MTGNPIFRSTSASLSFLYAGLILAAFAVVGVATWFAASNTAERQVRQDIELEVTAIKTELNDEGLKPMLAAIKARAEHPGALEYWVTDAGGRHLSGDFPAMDGPDGWRRISIGTPEAERSEEMIIHTVTLPGGIRLSVGDDLRRTRAVQDAILTMLALFGGGAVFLCLVVGVLMTRRAFARMEALNATLARVAAGDFSARFAGLPSSANDIERIGLAINAMLDRIEQLVSDVQRVSHDIAHDLRTPLTHLQQRLEQAKMETGETARIESVEAAQVKVAEILRIFDALLRLSEIEAGAAGRRLEPVDLGAIVDKVADAFRPDIEDCGHQLELTNFKNCHILGDPDLLAQALANLIENAMRHTPPGTRIMVQLFSDRDNIGVKVADDGPGIPDAEVDAVRKPFVRLDRSRTTPGSGLGLSLVAAIARHHGAEFNITNTHPGLTVSLMFKAAPSQGRN